MNCLLLIPHCDDEFFIGPLIEKWVEDGYQIRCLFLCESAHDRRKRRIESIQYLSDIGVEDVFFPFDESVALDGVAPSHLPLLHSAIERHVAGARWDVLVSPAWEGGHQDHDAVHYLAALLEQQHPRLQHWTYYTYNGYETRGKFFRVSTPIRTELASPAYVRLRYFDTVTFVLSAFTYYPTQWKSWVGLAPFFLARLLKTNQIAVYDSVDWKAEKPHEGQLLYERYGRTRWAEFKQHIANFRTILATNADGE